MKGLLSSSGGSLCFPEHRSKVGESGNFEGKRRGQGEPGKPGRKRLGMCASPPTGSLQEVSLCTMHEVKIKTTQKESHLRNVSFPNSPRIMFLFFFSTTTLTFFNEVTLPLPLSLSLTFCGSSVFWTVKHNGKHTQSVQLSSITDYE